MTLLETTALERGGVLWCALTVDAAELEPGAYASHLIVQADSDPMVVPVSVAVLSEGAPSSGGFGLWLISGGTADEVLDSPGVFKLPEYGVNVLTVAMPAGAGGEAAVAGAVRRAAALGLEVLGFSGCAGGFPPTLPAGGGHPAVRAKMPWLLWAQRGELEPAPSLDGARFEPAVALARLPAGKEEMPRVVPCHWLVEDGLEPGKARRLVDAGLMKRGQFVWVLLDLRGAHWRRAAVAVRNICWAAAWQGAAGLAVYCHEPFPEVDRQNVLWHILRDACEEAALWQAARRSLDELGRAELAAAELQARRAMVTEEILGLVADAPESYLRVAARRRPFREVMLVVGAAEKGVAPLSSCRAAKEKTLTLMAEADRLMGGKWENLYWQDVPLSDEKGVRWAIVAGAGEEMWKVAGDFQGFITSRTGRTVPVARAFPATAGEGGGLPALVWIVGTTEGIRDLPAELSAALAKTERARPTMLRMESGMVVVLIPGAAEMDAVKRTLHRHRALFSTAGEMR